MDQHICGYIVVGFRMIVFAAMEVMIYEQGVQGYLEQY